MLICQICKNTHLTFFHKINKHSYYNCTNCTTLSIFPKPSFKQINRYYKQTFQYTAGEINERKIRSRSVKILKQLKKLNPKGKTILDVGSGYGYFLEEAKKIRLLPEGIEPSEQLFLQSINRLDSSIHNITLEQFSVKSIKKYDFLTLIHTIEHVLQPKDLINNALKLLNKNGILYIETPNLDSHLFYAEKYEYTFLTPPDHIWLFSQKSFQRMLKNITNCKILKISSYSYSEHFMGVAKSFFKKYQIQKNKDLLLTAEKKLDSHQSINPPAGEAGLLEFIKYIAFDRILAPLFTPLLNIKTKGSFLELYIRKK